MGNINILLWIENWYKNNCNGDWEHGYGIRINTLDNPGWYIEIDLKGTILNNLTQENVFFEKDNNDWYSYDIKNSQFIGVGDPNKLEFLLNIFKDIAESYSK